MWNGETESSGEPTQPSDSNVVTGEIALQMAIEARDTYKSRLESCERTRDSISSKFEKAQELLETLIDDVDMSGGYTSVDTDTLKELCEALNVQFTVDLSVDISISVDITVPRGTTERDVRQDIDTYVDITIRSANDDLCEVTDWGIN